MSKKFLTAQVSPQFFHAVKIKLAHRGMRMRDAIVFSLTEYFDIDPALLEDELGIGEVNDDASQVPIQPRTRSNEAM